MKWRILILYIIRTGILVNGGLEEFIVQKTSQKMKLLGDEKVSPKSKPVSKDGLICRKILPESKSFLISETASDFRGLIKESNLIIDNTLLIKEILDTPKKILRIVCPNGWGKSINLRMVASFVALRVAPSGVIIPAKKTENYKLFVEGELMDKKTTILHKLERPLEISKQEKYIDKYLAKHPIVLLDFSTFNPIAYTFREFFTYFQKIIGELYSLYSFMVRRIRAFGKEMEAPNLIIIDDDSDNLINQFEMYKFRKEFNQTKMAYSIRFLCGLLYVHYDLEAFVFFDEYDKVINSLYSFKQYHEDTVKNISDFYYSVMKQSLMFNRHFNKALVTGVMNVEMGEERVDRVDISDRYTYNRDMFTQYGFTQDQVDQLFNFYEVPANVRSEVEQWYGGYRIAHRNQNVYTSRSIVKFLNQKALDNYRPLDENMDLFAHTIMYEEIKNSFQSLMNGQSVEFEYIENLNYTDIITLKRSIWGGPVSDTTTRLNLVLQCLYAMGFLTFKEVSEYNEILAKIPNREVEGIWGELMSNNTQNPER